MPIDETSFPSLGTGSACRLVGPSTQKQMSCQVEGPVETLQPSLLALALALLQRKGQASSPLIPGPCSRPQLASWLAASPGFHPKGSHS